VTAASERDLEPLRLDFLPDDVRLLFLGESPPAGGTFFYLANSKLCEATKEAFRSALPDQVRGPNFLVRFAELGCYLDDLCLEPVNHPSSTTHWRRQSACVYASKVRHR
jgi:hypothetical protein